VDGQVKYRSKKLAADGWIIPDKLPEATPMAMRLWLDGISRARRSPSAQAEGEALTELFENALPLARSQKHRRDRLVFKAEL
jgi:hypothetical protein